LNAAVIASKAWQSTTTEKTSFFLYPLYIGIKSAKSTQKKKSEMNPIFNY